MFASNHPQVFRQQQQQPNSINKNDGKTSNINANVVMNGAMSKTPAASGKQRRALGDISNRKQGRLDKTNSNGVGGGLSVKKAVTPGLRLQLPLQQQDQRMPLSTKKPGFVSKRSEVSFMPRPTTTTTQATKQAPSLTIFSNASGNQNSITNKTAGKSILKHGHKSTSTSKNNNASSVDDIELSAGRLWIDQQQDYDDDDSIASLSLPGASTVLEDFATAARKRHAFRLKSNLEEERREQAAFDEYEKKLFEEDDDDIVGADVWIERTLSFGVDLDEELSFDAPSYCADISF